MLRTLDGWDGQRMEMLAGTEGYGYRVEAIQIKIVKKGHRHQEQPIRVLEKMDINSIFNACTRHRMANVG